MGNILTVEINTIKLSFEKKKKLCVFAVFIFCDERFHHSFLKKRVSVKTLRNQVFATSSDFLIPLSSQSNVVDLRYFKL